MSVNGMIEFIAALLILVGSIMAVISAIGIIRFQDVYSRSHAATKSSTLAVSLTLSGVFIYLLVSESIFSVRMIMGIVFVLLTSPVAGHLIIRAAYRSGVEMTDATLEDELAEVLKKKEKQMEEEKASKDTGVKSDEVLE
ncbi:Na+/H+ antiporter subunit G [Oceanobacillus caeni]|uniref:Na+/H+ antiporter subunit G n=1 Tax=Oceanobacillus caeni TaxID=405946 RepID=UPI0023EB8782|nr:Na+/H+ antiporter subunit G [Oceanobacillus caeni]